VRFPGAGSDVARDLESGSGSNFAHV
jgi:hypothetical protein